MNETRWQRDLLPLLPRRIQNAAAKISREHAESLEEIRIRAQRPVQLIGSGWESFLTANGEGSILTASDLTVTYDECADLLSAISFHSVYAFEEEIRRGYVTLPGGYRVGLSGKAITSNDTVERLTKCTFFNFRISREVRGAADRVMPVLLCGGRPQSTLVLSPPGCGKTTLLRDIARQLSNGERGALPQKVCIADERSEIAGCFEGVPQLDVGVRTDVMDGCNKAEAMEMMLRALSPDVLVTDEIGSMRDCAAIEHAANAGTVLIASAHADSAQDVLKRPALMELQKARLFKRYILLGRMQRPGCVVGLYDEELKPVMIATKAG